MNDDAAQGGPVLDDEQFRRLAEYGEVEHAQVGQNLYTTGDDSYDFFLLQSATVDIVRDPTAIEPERLIYRGGPGDFLGELNLLTERHARWPTWTSPTTDDQPSYLRTVYASSAAR